MFNDIADASNQVTDHAPGASLNLSHGYLTQANRILETFVDVKLGAWG